MPYKDPVLRRENQRKASNAWYQRNKETHKAATNLNKLKNRRKWAEFKKTLECVNCGEKRPGTLDFHHFDRSNPLNRKVNELTQLGSYGKALEEIQLRCTVLCASCHRAHHYAELAYKKKQKD